MRQPMATESGVFSVVQRQDLRSLAAFRICSGFYILYDIYTRLQYGRLDLLWYTSSDGSFLHPDNTPHRSPVHRIWFYRGSEIFQICLFAILIMLGVSFMVGYKCNTVTKFMLWMSVVGMQCRCMPLHDGSDTYFRHLLLWSIQLPVSQLWSIDSYLSRLQQQKLPPISPSSPVPVQTSQNLSIENSAAVWGIRLQIVIMYVGTVLNRTVDKYGFAICKSKWLPPQLSAVYYALNSTFATRDFWLANYVRKSLPLTKLMTFCATIMEGGVPILCLLIGDQYIHICAFILFKLHFGLLIFFNLPNWQLVGMLATVLWIPARIWDGLQNRLSAQFPSIVRPLIPTSSLVIGMKKKDLCNISDNNEEEEQIESIKGSNRRRHRSTLIREDSTSSKREMKTSNDGSSVASNGRRKPFLTYFLLSYMLYDFVGNRNLFHKLDDGDIGEFLRFSQYWVMYSGPPTISHNAIITGTTLDGMKHVNVWEWMRSGNIKVVDMEALNNEMPWTNMTRVYPSPRIERIFSDWASDANHSQNEYFLRNFCEVVPFTYLEMTMQRGVVQPPGGQRFSHSRGYTSIHVAC